MGYMVILDVVAVGSRCAVEVEDGRDITLSRDSMGTTCGALFVLARCAKRKFKCSQLPYLRTSPGFLKQISPNVNHHRASQPTELVKNA